MFSRRTGASSPSDKRKFSWRRPREVQAIASPQGDCASQASSSSSSDTPYYTDVSSPLPPLLFFSHSTGTDSIVSSESISDDIWPMPRSLAPSSLRQVPENQETNVRGASTDELPAYSASMTPSVPVTYNFVRTSPFAMVVSAEGASNPREQGLYHVGVGANIWMPNCTVTTVRRGSNENGLIVAEIELGISSVAATVTIGGVSKTLQQVYFRKSSTSSSRLYFTGDGATIKWKLGPSSWQAHIDSTLLATFTPTPPRKLTLQPAGHPKADHIIISLIILMREHLTPAEGIRGSSAELFNYSTHHTYQED